MSDYLNGLKNVISNFNKIDTSKDGKIDKTEIDEAVKNQILSPEGTKFLERIINNNNLFNEIVSIENDGDNISPNDLKTLKVCTDDIDGNDINARGEYLQNNSREVIASKNIQKIVTIYDLQDILKNTPKEGKTILKLSDPVGNIFSDQEVETINKALDYIGIKKEKDTEKRLIIMLDIKNKPTNFKIGPKTLKLLKSKITGETLYTVKGGDNLSEIADSFGISVKMLRAANPDIGDDVSNIQPGDKIIIPLKN